MLRYIETAELIINAGWQLGTLVFADQRSGRNFDVVNLNGAQIQVQQESLGFSTNISLFGKRQQIDRDIGLALYCDTFTSYSNSICLSVCPSVCPSVTRRYCVKTTARSPVQIPLSDSKMCLVL